MAGETHITEPMKPTSTVFSEMLAKMIERDRSYREMTPEEALMEAWLRFLDSPGDD